MNNREDILSRVNKEIAEHFEYYKNELKSGDKIVDIGVGTGNTAGFIKNHIKGVSVLGVDIINSCQNAEIPVTLYKNMTMPSDDKEFDVALLFYVLHHSKSPGLILEEAKRITRRAVLIIEDFHIGSWDEDEELDEELQVQECIGLPTHNVHHSGLQRDSLKRLIEEKGFRIEKSVKLPSKTTRKIEKWLYILSIPQ